MNISYFFELSTNFWISLSAGYFLLIPVTQTVQEQISNLSFTAFCFLAAYYCRKQQQTFIIK